MDSAKYFNNVEDVTLHKSIEPKEVELGFNRNVITGDKNHLFNSLKESFKNAKSIDIIVSFLMESGVKLLENEFKLAKDRGVKFRILTGNYLNITQPQALYLIKDILGDSAKLKFYNEKNRSFHPKGYIFHHEDYSEIFVGSSNISRSALTYGIEWNYRLTTENSKEDFNEFYNTFLSLFNNHSYDVTEDVMQNYSKNWIRPKVYIDMEKMKEESNITSMYQPRGAQIEALYELKKSREEGLDKAVVVAATGVGKTYLSVFDSLEFEKILFVAHREEILKQSAKSFKNVRPNKSIGFFYSDKLDTDKDITFALVQKLGRSTYLNENYFKKDQFDYIVIDEFHHAVSKNYRNIIEYFNPRFLLGLTATPERLDNKDVFALCDHNLVYEIRLQESINRGLLVPFRYYGIYDETVKYEAIREVNGRFDEKELEKALNVLNRANLILKHYKKYRSKRAMGFCATRSHAEYMAKYFSENGVSSVAVHSGESSEYSCDREEAIEKLTSGEINIIFSVDMFNEGIDIASIDLVMFLRPTESPTIFLQQLGRGLRKYENKGYLNVLDFIGNYKKANLVPFLLSGRKYDNDKLKESNPQHFEYAEGCIVDYDLELIDIFKKIAEKEMTIKDKVREEFYRIKEDLGHAPSRVEFFTYMDDDIYLNIKSKKSLNPFKDYLGYLNELDELGEEKEWFNSIGKDFINMIETTSMSKTYKMPLLLAFYNDKDVKLKIDDEDIYLSFKSFYSKGSNKVDMLKDKSTSNFDGWDKKKYLKLAKDNPIKFMSKTHSEFFTAQDDMFCINEDIREFLKFESFINNFKDAIDFRVSEYYKNRFLNKLDKE